MGNNEQAFSLTQAQLSSLRCGLDEMEYTDRRMQRILELGQINAAFKKRLAEAGLLEGYNAKGPIDKLAIETGFYARLLRGETDIPLSLETLWVLGEEVKAEREKRAGTPFWEEAKGNVPSPEDSL